LAITMTGQILQALGDSPATFSLPAYSKEQRVRTSTVSSSTVHDVRKAVATNNKHTNCLQNHNGPLGVPAGVAAQCDDVTLVMLR
jgi:hypothetical protein